jgi:hypothetical protein
VHALRDFVEHEQIPNATEGPEEPHEVLRESPMLGDGKFKLEIGGKFLATISQPAYNCQLIKYALQLKNPKSQLQPPRFLPLLSTKNNLHPSSMQRPTFPSVSHLSC